MSRFNAGDLINIRTDTSGTLDKVIMERHGINHRQLYAIDYSPLRMDEIATRLVSINKDMSIAKVNEIMGIDSDYKGPSGVQSDQ